MNSVLQTLFRKDCLKNLDEFYGVVVNEVQRTNPSGDCLATQITPADNSDQTLAPYSTYQVYIPELECRPMPLSYSDPVIYTYKEYCISSSLLMSPGAGSIVIVRFNHPSDLERGLIVGVEGAIDGGTLATLRQGLQSTYSAQPSKVIQGSASKDGWGSKLPELGFTSWVHPVDPSKFRISSAKRRRTRPTGPRKGELQDHSGVDLAGPHGSPIFAVTKGTVTYLRSPISKAAGWNLEVYHGTWTDPATGKEHGVYSRYLHLRNKGSTDHSTDQAATKGTITAVSDYAVTLGQEVAKSTVLGYVGSTGGSTGPHLHYELILSENRGQKGSSVYRKKGHPGVRYLAGIFESPSDAPREGFQVARGAPLDDAGTEAQGG